MTTTTVLAYLPSPPQGVWHLGPLPIRAYALCIIVGIIVGCWWGSRRWRARGGQEGEVLDVAVWAVPFGLIGGRIYHVITDWPTYFGATAAKAPIDALKIWEGGLGIWGAVAFGALGAWIGCRRHGIKLAPFGDAIAPAILLAQAIGRLGNYFNQELFGGTTTLPWGLEIFDRRNDFGQVGPNVIDGVSTGQVSAGLVPAVHPTFLYELLWNVIVVLILVIVDRYLRIGHGRLFALYVAGYCLGRFGIELMRTDHASQILGIRVNVFTAVIVFACAAAYFALAPKGRELGLTMYQPWRAAELEDEGIVGYVDEFADDGVLDDGSATDEGDGVPDDEKPVIDSDDRVEPAGGEPDGAEEPDGIEPAGIQPGTQAEPASTESIGAEPTSVEPASAGPALVQSTGPKPDGEDDDDDVDRIVSASNEIAAPASTIFELIADPAQQPRWDGNDNLASADPGQRVRKVGDVFETTTTKGHLRRNHVVEFAEGRLIAWLPAEPDATPPGHLWRWALSPVDDDHTLVTHTYDWTRLDDPNRLDRARSTTADKLLASVERLAELAQATPTGPDVDAPTEQAEPASQPDPTPNVTPNIVKRSEPAVQKSAPDSDETPAAT